ncbi:MAG: hypothetical protein LKG25_04865 [Prevotella sp.]|nr:hypothetical protein [Prevotella sp.]MCI1281908.1 hypothetical protein [Prevotella sp.]
MAEKTDGPHKVISEVKSTTLFPLTSDGLNGGNYLRDFATYDATTKTITYPAIDATLLAKVQAVDASVTSVDQLTTADFVKGWNYRWGGAGKWNFQDMSDAKTIVVEFAEAIPYAVTLKVQGDVPAATDTKKETAQSTHTVVAKAEAGATSVTLNLKEALDEAGTSTLSSVELQNIEYIRLQMDYPADKGGTLKLSNVYLTKDVDVPAQDESYFPLTQTGFNIGIWNPDSKNTYDATTKTLVTGPYCVAGWEYSPAIDLSSYDNLVVELAAKQTCGTQIRVWDGGFWDSCAEFEFGDNTTLTVDLKNMKKGDNHDGNLVNTANITRVGFWSFGSSPIVISKAYLTKTTTTGIKTIQNTGNSSENVNVFNLSGVRVRANVSRSSALNGLAKGVYILEGKKVVVK